MMADEVHFGDAVVAYDRMFAETEVIAGWIHGETVLNSGVDINKSRLSLHRLGGRPSSDRL